ncbi:MAG: superoxide dismutase [Gammaproteobacteria bacterium]|jgi:Fe-Mn family superoxide dismutase
MGLAAEKLTTLDELEHATGQHELPPLPYAMDALEPVISRETLEYHYGKHHAGYVKKLNAALSNSKHKGKSIEDIIRHLPSGNILNNAAQVWNHTFYWNCMSPDGSGKPAGELATAIDRNFGSFDRFQKAFTKQAAARFGSGWAWLVKRARDELAIVTTPNAENPMRKGDTPLLTCDVWEHAYYIDYRHDRPGYLEAFWRVVDWEFVARNYQG